MKLIAHKLPNLIFFSRWLQAPLYVGLIVVLITYVYQFSVGLVHLVLRLNHLTETELMLSALDLIDVVMIANLLIMVIVGGYETFVAKISIGNEEDRPEWLNGMNAGTMKVKLALALIGISSIHLLRTFIEPSAHQNYSIMWQVIIHMTLVISALSIAFTNKVIDMTHD